MSTLGDKDRCRIWSRLLEHRLARKNRFACVHSLGDSEERVSTFIRRLTKSDLD